MQPLRVVSFIDFQRFEKNTLTDPQEIHVDNYHSKTYKIEKTTKKQHSFSACGFDYSKIHL